MNTIVLQRSVEGNDNDTLKDLFVFYCGHALNIKTFFITVVLILALFRSVDLSHLKINHCGYEKKFLVEIWFSCNLA